MLPYVAVDDDEVLQGILRATREDEQPADGMPMVEHYKRIIETAQKLQNQPGTDVALSASLARLIQRLQRMIERREGK